MIARELWSALALVAAAAGGGDQVVEAPLRWDARAVEHLYNRAGFGASGPEIACGLSLGPEQLVDALLAAESEWEPIEAPLFLWEHFGLDHLQSPLMSSDYYGMERAEQIDMCKDSRTVERGEFLRLYEQYFASMVEQRAPLRDRMMLFWHGFFTTSLEVNKRKFELIRQFEWMRGLALESYADLLRGIVRDPAMLQYLDNTSNSAAHPNENLARELMELFSLGEGHYSEHDVREAARALTGHAGTAEGTYRFLAEQHDEDQKTILGVTGPHDADDLVEILLREEACAEYVARRLIRWFEGVEPDAARLSEYAALLRDGDYELRPFLRRLFLDPRFYRDEVVGARVWGPIEYLVVVCRKLGLETPPPEFLNLALRSMGQSLYRPPTVEGWPEGLEWIASDALLRRANCVGLLTGVLRRPASSDEPDELRPSLAAIGEALRDPELQNQSRALAGRHWRPRAQLLGDLKAARIESDAALVERLCEDWLAIEPTPQARELLGAALRAQREVLGISEAELYAHPAAFDHVLRGLAHLVFSLPEAQLG